ncbi:MAG: thioester reductase domain-containing protein [Isosphaeraceae bacterium]
MNRLDEIQAGVHAGSRPGAAWLDCALASRAQLAPRDVVLVEGERCVTALDLAARAHRLAHFLLGQGLGTDRLVGLHAARSIEQVVGLLGILEAGAAWLLLDDRDPAGRIDATLKSARPELILTQELLRDRLGDWPGKVVAMDADWTKIEQASGASPEPRSQGSDLASVVHAVGRGILGTRSGLQGHLGWLQKQFALDSSDAVLHHAPPCQGAAFWEILWPLLCGARLVLAPRPLEITSLPALIAEYKVSVLHLDTADLAAFLAAAHRHPAKSLASLREVLCSGEPLRRPVIEAFFVLSGRVQAAIRASREGDAPGMRKLQLTFLHGPDEAGTAATAFTCREDDIREVAPLGKPTHVAVYVLDRHQKPVPFGVAGEICIVGDGLARGYLNDAKETAERFRSAALPGRSGVRLFRSGDTGRLRRDGTIELVAPARGTAWIAGFRCPLDEIEDALLREPSIVECVVRARAGDEGGSKLWAYVVPNGPYVPERLEAHARAVLPAPIAEVRFVPLTALPRTGAGLLDEQALDSLEAIDGNLMARWEKALRALPEIEEVAVVAQERREAGRLLHLWDLLSRQAAELRGSGPVPQAPCGCIRDATAPSALATSDGGPLHTEADAPVTLGATLRQAALRTPTATVSYLRADGDAILQTYRELLADALSVLAGLNRLGLLPGDKVILQLEHSWDFLPAFWACSLGGLVPAPLPIPPTFEQPTSALDRLRQAWTALEGPLVLTSRGSAPALAAAAAAFGGPPARVAVMEDLRGECSEPVAHDSLPEDLALLMFTSGSTGTAKGVVLSHQNVLAMCAGTIQLNEFTSQDVTLNWVGLDHVGALVFLAVMPVYLGCPQIQAPTATVMEDPLRWLEWLDRYRVTISWAPNFVYGLLNERVEQMAARRLDLSAVRFLTNAGEAIVPGTALRFLQLLEAHGLPRNSMRPAFGMTETCSGITWSNRFPPDPSSADEPVFVELGPPIPGASLRIVDDRDQVVLEGTIGRLQVKGLSVTSGYYQSPELTRAAIHEGGWLETGDLGFLDEGRLTLTGREKDLIIINGVNYPNHAIEAAVEEVEGVEPSWTAACAVRARGAATEQLAVIFNPRPTAAEPTVALVRRIRERIVRSLGVNPTYIVPLAQEAIPKTAIGKIERALLARRLESGAFDDVLKRLDLQSGGRRTIPDWSYQTAWRPREAVRRTPRRGEGRVLVFADQSGLVERLCGRGGALAEVAVLVGPSTEFQRQSADRYRLDPGDPDHYVRLFESLSADCEVIDRVLHLATYTVGGTAILDLGALRDAERRGAYSLLHLVGELARQSVATRPAELLVISSRSQATTPQDEVCPEKALVAGLIATVSLELPWLSVRHVDLAGEKLDLDLASATSELIARPSDREVAYRRGKRLVPRLETVDWQSLPQQDLPVRRGGMYLLTGGLGGIGREVAAWLLREHEVRLLILGRTSSPPRAQWQQTREEQYSGWERIDALEGLEKLGTIRYEAVDVGDESAVRQMVGRAETDWDRRLDGVIHSAGVRHECALSDETSQSFAAALRPKVEGAWVLDRLVRERPGCVFVAFSSVNSTFGGTGVGAYAASNRFLELLTHELSRRGQSPTWCIAWSMWDEVGMSRDYPLKELARNRGFLPIGVDQGINSLRVVLSRAPRSLLVGIEGTNPYLRSHVESDRLEIQHLVGYFTTRGKPPAPDRLLALEVRDQFQRRSHCAFVQLPELPRTESGAIDRDRLSRLVGQGDASAHYPKAPRTELERQLARLWQEVFQVPRVTIDDNFFEMGGHSLLAAQLMARVAATLSVDLPLSSLFSDPTVAGLARAIESHRQGGSTAESVLDLRAEAELPASIQPGALRPDRPARAAHVFVSGATGFLGAFLLRDLLEQTGSDVTCLVRARSATEGLNRIQSNLASYSLWRDEYASRLIPLAGDFAQPRLGLAPGPFHELAERIDVIYHNGALVNFIFPYQALKAANVEGTTEILRLACTAQAKPVHYVSTLSVFPLIDLLGAGVAHEDDVFEHPDMLMDGYSQTKWVAEGRLRAAAARGLPVTIYRPGRITGDSRTGKGEPDDAMWKLILQSIQSELAPAVEVTVDMTPVDFASKAIVHLSAQPDSAGRTFHLVNPQPVSWSALCDHIRARGYPLRTVSVADWKDQASAVLGQDLEKSMFAWLPLVAALTTGEGPLVLPQLRYDCAHTLGGLEGTSIACPPVDNRLLGTYFDHLVRSSVLRPPSLS